LRIVLTGPHGGEGDVTFTKQLHSVAKEAPTDPLGPEGGIDVNLRDLSLETGARIEEHTPTEPYHLSRRSGRQNDVLASEPRTGRGRDIVLDLILGQLRMVVVALFIEHELAQQRANQVMLGGIENADRDIGRCGPVYVFPPAGAASSTPRIAWTAPSRAAVSTGTTILVFSLSANLDSVSSCRMETSVGSGAAALIA